MRVRESGMPEERVWAEFFDPEWVLDRLAPAECFTDVLDLGCGYGTFTVPAARRAGGSVYALDMDPAALAATRDRAAAAGLTNVRCMERDFLAEGTGLEDGVVDLAMLFNLLHAEQPMELLAEAYRCLRGGGRLALIHWNPDPDTPRGPPMHIRPTPAQCLGWALAAGYEAETGMVDLPPYHYGLRVRKAMPGPYTR